MVLYEYIYNIVRKIIYKWINKKTHDYENVRRRRLSHHTIQTNQPKQKVFAKSLVWLWPIYWRTFLPVGFLIVLFLLWQSKNRQNYLPFWYDYIILLRNDGAVGRHRLPVLMAQYIHNEQWTGGWKERLLLQSAGNNLAVLAVSPSVSFITDSWDT